MSALKATVARYNCAAAAPAEFRESRLIALQLQVTPARSRWQACLRVSCLSSRGAVAPERGPRNSRDGSLHSTEDSQAKVEEEISTAALEDSGSSSSSDAEEDDGRSRRIVRLRALKRAALIREIMVRRQLLLASSMVVGVTLSTALAPWMPDLEAVAAFLEDIPQFTQERDLRGLPLVARVAVPEETQGVIEDEEPEEVLVLEVKVIRTKPSQFDVFLNVPDATEATPTSCVEYVGSFFNEPQSQSTTTNSYREAVVRMGISETMDQLGLGNASSVLVSIVPKGPDKNNTSIIVQGLRIEYE